MGKGLWRGILSSPCNCPRETESHRWQRRPGRGCAGCAMAGQDLLAEPGGTISHGQARDLIPGCCRGADVARGWSAGARSHPPGSEQLAGGGWVWVPASPWNVSWKSSMLLAWREGGMVRGKEE